MKKILLSVLFISLVIPAFCQNDNQYEEILKDLKEDIKEAVDNPDENDYTPLLWESDDRMFRLYTVSHIGYGLYCISNSNFVPAMSGEFFVNLVRLGFYPIDDWGLEMNLDYGHNALRSIESVLLLDDQREVYAVPAQEFHPSNARRTRSSLEYSSINIPFLIKYDYGNMSFGLGTEISMNLGARAKYKYNTGHDTYSFVGKRAAINTFTYAFAATASYYDLGLFVKWYPKHAGILSGRNLDMKKGYVSIGISFGL